MKSRQNHKIFILFAFIALILMTTTPSFADTTKIIYDDVNRVIRVESGIDCGSSCHATYNYGTSVR